MDGRTEIPNASEALSHLWGDSADMDELRCYLPKLGRSDATVLITGETGTGKERVASIIHQLGSRADKPFIPVNCAAIPDSLVESELFGHERGAFTGAQSAFAGKFEQSEGGTIFLDEIGEMPFQSQAKLLRTLENGEVTRVGSSQTRRVDVRIIAATNQPLEEMIGERRFRSDLYYRLNVAPLELSPLRDRPSDIEPIMKRFIAAFNQRHHCALTGPDPDLLASLTKYSWPGNIRELRNMVEAIFIDPPDCRKLGIGDLPIAYRKLVDEFHHNEPAERERMIQTLKNTNWNKAEAAKQLHWSRMTLYRKLAKYDLDDR